MAGVSIMVIPVLGCIFYCSAAPYGLTNTDTNFDLPSHDSNSFLRSIGISYNSQYTRHVPYSLDEELMSFLGVTNTGYERDHSEITRIDTELEELMAEIRETLNEPERQRFDNLLNDYTISGIGGLQWMCSYCRQMNIEKCIQRHCNNALRA